MHTVGRTAWLSPLRHLVRFGVLLVLLVLGACGDNAQNQSDGPLIRLHVTPVDGSVDKAVLSVAATDAMGVSKTNMSTFTAAPYDLLGVTFPVGTRGATSFQVDLYSGSCLVGTGTATLTIDSDNVVDLNVTIKAIPLCGNGVTLTVQIANIEYGKGTVSSDPAGISCDASGKGCTVTVMKSTRITLTATNSGGAMSSFNGWSGGGCSGIGTCAVPMDQDTTVQAVFTSRHGWYKETLPGVISANLNGVGGTLSSNVLVVGDSGTALRWNGSAWNDQSTQTGGISLRGVAGQASRLWSVYLVGDTAKIFKWTTTMTPLTTTSTSNLNSVVIAANGLGYVVGSVGESLLIGTNGAVASGQLAIGTTTMNSICATTGGDFVVGGNKATVNAVAGLWDGNKKTTAQMATGPAVPGNIYATLCGGTYHYAAGDGGVIVRRSSTAGQDNAWMTQTTNVTTAIRGMWSSGDTFIIAVGDGGTILQYDGVAWKTMTSNTTANLRAVWGTSPTNIFAVGDGGTVLHYTP
ncbi:MAG: hypothetical protein U0787_15500 [Polyangia bacterium]